LHRYEYWVVENTGWSGGASWFRSNDDRYTTKEDAVFIAMKYKERLPDSKHRVTHIQKTVESFSI